MTHRIANACHMVCTVKSDSTGRWSMNIIRYSEGAGITQNQVHSLIPDIVLESVPKVLIRPICWKSAGLVVLVLLAERLIE